MKLLKNSPATASIVTDSDEAILVHIEGKYLDELFNSNPKLPGRFFAYLATYQATRLRNLTDMVSGDKREVAGQHLANVTIQDIFSLYRDHYEGTPYDLTQGVVAGPFHNPMRWAGTEQPKAVRAAAHARGELAQVKENDSHQVVDLGNPDSSV